MQERNRLLVFLVTFLLCISIASAQKFTVTDFAVSNKVIPGGTALYTLTIYNNQTRADNFEIKADPLAVYPFNEYFENIIASPSRITIRAMNSATVNVTLMMRTQIEHGKFYSNYMTVRSENTGETLQHRLAVKILAPESIITVKPVMPSAVPPMGTLEFDAKFMNNINQQLSNVEVMVSSDLFEEKKQMIFFPFQDRTETFTFKIETTEPKSYPLSIRVYHKGQLVGKASASFSVSEKADMKEKTETTTELLKKTVIATRVNMGNTIIEDSYSLQVGWFARMFTKTNTEPTMVDGGYHWTFVMNPGEKFDIISTTNYRPLFVASLVVLLFAIIIYFIFTRGVIIRKEVLKIRQTSEGMCEFKALLHIKNKTSKQVKNLSIIEVLPSMVKPIPHFGTLKPDSIQKGPQGIRMIWKIDELIRGEERIISYRIETKVGIVGKYMLPPALLRYKGVRNRTVNVKSNSINFLP